MASRNLSKEKRDRLIAKIEELKRNADEESVAILNEIEIELSKKKYGLVWEEHSEEVEEQMLTKVPIFSEEPEKELQYSKDEAYSFILEGDNLHSLKLLEKTHKGKIDVIYIDPPYNTGAKNWKYNNDYVDSVDTFRHSKWISFMYARLVVAKRLLKKTGIIIVTIDDYEIENLTLLMNEIFSEDNRLGTVAIKNNPQGRSSVTGFQISHEYALFYGNGNSSIGRLPRNEQQIARYKEEDEFGPFEWRNFRAQYSTESPKMVYPIYVKNDGSGFRIPDMVWNQEKQEYDVLERIEQDEHITLPIDNTGRMRTWKWGIETVKKVQSSEMGVRKDNKKEWTVYYKGRMKTADKLPYTFWDNPEYSASTYGANLLADMIGKKKFDYPKSLYAVIDCLKVGNLPKDGIVLDFFAGSGTTGHAVLELNSLDNGDRRFILCTNNENAICEEVTYPRIKTAITGLRPDGTVFSEGRPANLKYYRTGFVNKNNEGSFPNELLKYVRELIQLEMHCTIDDIKTCIALSDDEIDEILVEDSKCEKLFISSDVLLSSKQSNMIQDKKIEVFVIPEYYFSEELREVNEV